MRSTTTLLTLLIGAAFHLPAPAQAQTTAAEKEVHALCEELSAANLKGDVAVLDRLYVKDFLLTSQSGKRFLREDSIADSSKGFESYANSDYTFRPYGDTVIVNYVNDRRRKNVAEAARFRVTAVWVKTKEGWRMAALQSTKIAG